MSKITSFEAAVAEIPSGAYLAVVGVIGWIVPEKLLRTLGQRYLNTGAPGNLNLFVPCFGGDNAEIKGIDNLMHDGMTKRLITGSFINPPTPKLVNARGQWVRSTTIKSKHIHSILGL